MGDGLYQRNLETRPWPEVQRAAFEKAKLQLERVYNVSPFYKRKYDEAGVVSDGLRTTVLPAASAGANFQTDIIIG